MSGRRRGLARRAFWFTTVVIVVGVVAVSPYAGTALIVSTPVSSPDVIVSLASHEWERLPEAAALAKRYPKAVVVLTLPERVTQYNCHDCAHRAEWLVNAGVEGDRIRVLALTEGGTYGEALATRNYVSAFRVHSVLLVTSPYHTRRSLATFRHALGNGVSVGISPATATSPARPQRWWAAAYDRAYVRYEWAAILYYRFRHGVPLLRGGQ